jgi:hypothetical protein
VSGGRKLVHIDADLRDQGGGQQSAYAGNGDPQRDGRVKCSAALLDLLFQHENLAFQEIQMVHHLAEPESVMPGNTSFQGPAQPWDLASQLRFGHLRQTLWILLAFDHGFQHGPTGPAEYIAGDRSQFNVGIF